MKRDTVIVRGLGTGLIVLGVLLVLQLSHPRVAMQYLAACVLLVLGGFFLEVKVTID